MEKINDEKIKMIWEEIKHFIKNNQNPWTYYTHPIHRGNPIPFQVEIDNNEIIITTRKGNKVHLYEDEFIKIYPLHRRRENGESITEEAKQITRRQVYFFALIYWCYDKKKQPLYPEENKTKNKKTYNNYISNIKLHTDSISELKLKKSITIDEKNYIERTAVNTVINYYEKCNFFIKSVESENCGWDFIVNNKNEEFFIEVKGTLNNIVNFQLTPNEFKKLQENLNKYRIAVVTNCPKNSKEEASKEVTLTIYKIRKEKRGYIGYALDNGQNEIRLIESISAIGQPSKMIA